MTRIISIAMFAACDVEATVSASGPALATTVSSIRYTMNQLVEPQDGSPRVSCQATYHTDGDYFCFYIQDGKTTCPVCETPCEHVFCAASTSSHRYMYLYSHGREGSSNFRQGNRKIWRGGVGEARQWLFRETLVKPPSIINWRSWQ